MYVRYEKYPFHLEQNGRTSRPSGPEVSGRVLGRLLLDSLYSGTLAKKGYRHVGYQNEKATTYQASKPGGK